MQFAISIEGEEQGRWVLETDCVGERFLITDNENNFRWINIQDAKLLKVATPEMPRLVALVQPQKLALPELHVKGLNGK